LSEGVLLESLYIGNVGLNLLVVKNLHITMSDSTGTVRKLLNKLNKQSIWSENHELKGKSKGKIAEKERRREGPHENKLLVEDNC